MKYKIVFGCHKYGFIASNYNELVSKCSKKFQILQDVLTLSLEDDTIVDEEYFSIISTDELLYLHITKDESKSVLTHPKTHMLACERQLLRDCQLFLQHCLSVEADLRAHVKELLNCKSLLDFHNYISEIPTCDLLAAKSTRKEHPDWFAGLSSHLVCKEQVLRSSAECRVRGYFQLVQKYLREICTNGHSSKKYSNCADSISAGEVTSQDLEACDTDERDGFNICVEDEDENIFCFRDGKEAEQVDGSVTRKYFSILHEKVDCFLAFLKNELKLCRYNQSYFDRTETNCYARLCDIRGIFFCDGIYNEQKCLAFHKINPYASREQRIIFSTWNLDHVIEKSRSVLPELASLLQSSTHLNNINFRYFFDLLFTKHRSCCCLQSEAGLLHTFNSKSFCLQESTVDVCLSHSVDNNSGFLTVPSKKKRNCDKRDGNIFPSKKMCGLEYSDKVPSVASALKTSRSSKTTLSTNTLTVASKYHHLKNDCNGLLRQNEDAPSHSTKQPQEFRCSVPSCSGFLLDRPWKGNLKLVHIACHIKKPHEDSKCDKKYMTFCSNE